MAEPVVSADVLATLERIERLETETRRKAWDELREIFLRDRLAVAR